MKLLNKSIFITVLTVLLAFSLSSCLGGDDEDIGEDGHTHEWGEPTLQEAPTCESEGCNEYICSICSESKYETVAPTGHLWNFDGATWSWDEFDSAEATVECLNTPSHAEVFGADISSKTTKNPTYSSTGTKTYTATAVVGDKTLTDSKTEILPAKQHPVIEDEFVDYSTFQAEYYAKEYQKRKTSYGYEYLKLLENDKGFMGSVLAWESMHLLAEPSYEIGQMSRTDLYTIVIYDILTGESGSFETPFAALESKSTGYLNSVANAIFGDGLLNKDALEQMKLLNPKDYKDIVANSAVFSEVEFVQNIFTAANDLFEAAEKCSLYEALKDMSDSYKEILLAISNDYDNDFELRQAAKNMIDAIDDMNADLTDQVLHMEFAGNIAESFLSMFWDNLWKDILLAYYPPLFIAQLTAKGAMLLTDAMFDIDGNVLAYYRLKVCIGFEMAMRRLMDEHATDLDYCSPKDQVLCIHSADVLSKSISLGFDYSIDLLNETLDTPTLSKDKKALIREYITEITNIKTRVNEIDEMFENTCMNQYDAYLKLDLHNYSPVDTVMVNLTIGNYSGTYTAPQGLQGVKIHVWQKKELLKNEAALAEYARIATEYEAKKLDGGAAITAEDIKYKLEFYVFDFVAIVEIFPTEESPDIEYGLFISEVSYDYKEGYNARACEWIQHNSYLLADFLYLNYERVITGRVYAQIGDVIYGSYVEVGEITLNFSST